MEMSDNTQRETRLFGIGGSPGICIGKAYIVDKEGVTLIMATHDPVIEEYAHIVFDLEDGHVSAVRKPTG